MVACTVKNRWARHDVVSRKSAQGNKMICFPRVHSLSVKYSAKASPNTQVSIDSISNRVIIRQC